MNNFLQFQTTKNLQNLDFSVQNEKYIDPVTFDPVTFHYLTQ